MKFRPHNEYFEFSINTWLIDLKINMRYITNILSQKLLTYTPPQKKYIYRKRHVLISILPLPKGTVRVISSDPCPCKRIMPMYNSTL